MAASTDDIGAVKPPGSASLTISYLDVELIKQQFAVGVVRSSFNLCQFFYSLVKRINLALIDIANITPQCSQQYFVLNRSNIKCSYHLDTLLGP